MKIENVRECPYCGFTYQAVLGQNTFAHLLSDPGASTAIHSVLYVCPHIACHRVEVGIDVGNFPAGLKGKPEAEHHKIRHDLTHSIFRRRILPQEKCGKERFHTKEIPEAVFRDYDEACRLLEVSPSASATYARRCLQNMIRARFKVKPGKLQNEIAALGSQQPPVRQEVVDALDTIRRMGKFKALPEDDVKVIVDIGQDEARQIIDVLEVLLCDWFLAPSEHNLRLMSLQMILAKRVSDQ